MSGGAVGFKNDGEYLDWLADHPEGFVLNRWSKPSPRYLVLHKATCYSISRYNRNRGATGGVFTRRDIGRRAPRALTIRGPGCVAT